MSVYAEGYEYNPNGGGSYTKKAASPPRYWFDADHCEYPRPNGQYVKWEAFEQAAERIRKLESLLRAPTAADDCKCQYCAQFRLDRAEVMPETRRHESVKS